MKVFFVGDNQSNVNWGRGASIALRQLLASSFEITGSVAGEWFDLSKAEAGYIDTLMPARHYGLFRQILNRETRRTFRRYMQLERFVGARDFIEEDPAASVSNLIANAKRYPALGRICDELNQADLMVVDGDGDIVFSTPPRRQTLFLLAMMELAVRLKKHVILVNSMISDCSTTGRNQKTLSAARKLFAQCRAVYLRDPESLEYAKAQMPEVNASFVPDSLFAWYPIFADQTSLLPANGDFLMPFPEMVEYWGKLDFSVPYICIGGGAQATTQPDKAVECYVRLVEAVKVLGCRVYLTENDFSDSFLRRVASETGVGIVPANSPILLCGAVLAQARLFISGRYHPSIFASLGGTPCIFLQSHAHKMGSLARLLDYENGRQYSSFPDGSEIAEIVSTAREYLDRGKHLRDKIRESSRIHCEHAARLPELLMRDMSG